MKNPKVSILCLTYNHEKYIKQALDSFLMQKTNFDFEVLIHDDASTDKTPQIIKQYQKKYPQIIKPIFSKYNKYSKGIRDLVIKYLLPKAKGKYIALCEGDDYWTHEDKLQIQVDFLDKNSDYVICFHPVKVIYEDEKNKQDIYPPFADPKNFNLFQLLHGNFIQTNSVMYRKLSKKQYSKLSKENFSPGDWYLHIYHARFGKIGFINKVMSVYRRHKKGLWSNAELNSIIHYKKNGLLHLSMYFEVIKLFPKNEEYKKVVLHNVNNIVKILTDIDKKTNSNLLKQAVVKYPELIVMLIDFINANTQITPEIRSLENQLQQSQLHIQSLETQLNTIKSAKFFRLWQSYCRIRDKILRRKI